MNESEYTFYTVGKSGGLVCIETIEYNNGATVASADGDKLTDNQMKSALRTEFPFKSFRICRQYSYIIANA